MAKARKAKASRPKTVKQAKATAYNKKNKAVKKAERKPFVECKTRSQYEIALRNRNQDDSQSMVYFNPLEKVYLGGQSTYPSGPPTGIHASACTFIPLPVFNRLSQGYRKDQMTGNAVFARSLALRTEFEFPYDANQIIHPYSVYLVCGRVKVPYAANNNTIPTDEGSTMADIQEHIESQGEEYFDAKGDALKFEKRTKRNITIDLYKKIVPRLDQNTTQQLFARPGHVQQFSGATTFTGAQSGAQQFGAHSTQPGVSLTVPTIAGGSIPHVRQNHTWVMNKKLHYTQGKDTATGGDATDPDIQNMFPNNTKDLPFALVLCSSLR